MPSRTTLRDQLVRAWHQTMTGPYRRQLINSERGLQVHFCMALLSMFKDGPRRLFVEPHLRVSGTRSLIPDILICNQRSIIGAVELKYKPKGKASFIGDMETLEALATPEADVEVRNHRFLGKRLPRVTYQMASDAVLCWAGVYRGEQQSVAFASPEAPHRRLLALHALTEQGENPTVFPTLPAAQNAA